MKEITKRSILINVLSFIVTIILAAACFLTGKYYTERKYISDENTRVIIIKDNESRNYDYEWYCDSIFHYDEDYYLDVLIETKEYNDYIDKHGQWW